MQTPLYGVDTPFKLRSNIVYFHDWRYVRPGQFDWLGPNDERVPMFGLGDVPPMHYLVREGTIGVTLRAEPAVKSPVVITAAEHEHTSIFAGSLIHEDGVYRLWYESWLRKDMTKREAGSNNALRYAESRDGVHWKLPNVGAYKNPGDKRHNIVYGAELTAHTRFHGGSVFKDPSAPKAERYKAFHLSNVKAKEYAKFIKRRPDAFDTQGAMHIERKGHCGCLRGATSPDGITWKPLRDPLLVQNSDTHNICEYDPFLKKYVAYVRAWYFGRRSIGRCETDDFRNFPRPENVFWPDAAQLPYDLWYANAKTVMPDAPDYHVMFPLRWRMIDDTFDFHLATSPDNVVWGLVPGSPVCKPGEPNDWDAATVVPGKGLVELPGDRIGVLYTGTGLPHKYPRRPPLGAIAWATWKKGRLVAMHCPLDGRVTLQPLQVTGRTMKLNHRTVKSGHIRVEIATGDQEALPGRSFADCDPIRGDELDRVVTWKGQSDLAYPEGAIIIVRFEMRQSDLFSVKFE